MKIKERAEYHSKPKPMTISSNAKLRKAIDMMVKKNYGSVVVTTPKGKVAGILTERDLMNRVLGARKDPDTLKVSDIMTTDVHIAKEDDLLVDWLRIMSNERFRRLPVVDEDEKLVNIMTQGDFVSYTWPELLGRIAENAKATLLPGYQITLIIGGMLTYALLVKILV